MTCIPDEWLSTTEPGLSVVSILSHYCLSPFFLASTFSQAFVCKYLKFLKKICYFRENLKETLKSLLTLCGARTYYEAEWAKVG